MRCPQGCQPELDAINDAIQSGGETKRWKARECGAPHCQQVRRDEQELDGQTHVKSTRIARAVKMALRSSISIGMGAPSSE